MLSNQQINHSQQNFAKMKTNRKNNPKSNSKQKKLFPPSFKQFKQLAINSNKQNNPKPSQNKQKSQSKNKLLQNKKNQQNYKSSPTKKPSIIKNINPIQNKSKKSELSEKYPDAIPIKIVFVGDGNCGKTSALISYTSNKFNQDYVPTVFDTYQSVIKRGQNTLVKLQLWDTAGQDQYKKLRSLSYPKTDVFFICFSMIEKKSFVNALQKWYNELKQNCPRAQFIFVGTKTDIKSQYETSSKITSQKKMEKSQVQYLDIKPIEKKINSMGLKFFTCSALTQEGLLQVFDYAIDKILYKKRNKDQIIKKSQQFECQII